MRSRTAAAVMLVALPLAAQTPQSQPHDLVVYGATAAGVVAAVTASRLGAGVVVLEPGQHVGGLTSGGLGATDTGNQAAIGGLAREFYRRVRAHYARPEAWTHERAEAFAGRGHRAGEDAAWTFEPRVAEQILRAMLAEAGVEVAFGERLDRRRGVIKRGAALVEVVMESGRRVAGRCFVDATYEGDLMALAGVGYTVGREANAAYGESLNGVQAARARHHQFVVDVDPYVVEGDPASGLLPGLQAGPPGADGAADAKVQAYCFRLCATDVAGNRRPWPKPADYDAQRYELLLRNFAAGDHRLPWHPVRMPNRKTDSNNNFAYSTDHIGGSWEYPDADYAGRARIVADHRSYQQGLMWTLANHPRVPAAVRRHFQTWGLARDEFVDTDNWPHQLYVREARRMVGAVVMTEHHCRGTRAVVDPVGLGAYGMDSHHVQRYATAAGTVRNEGDVQVGGFAPYGIAFGALVPRAEQCSNLLVPVCLSASHIAFGSIRMEPVFMVLAQAAATAACLAQRAGVTLHELPYADLRRQLLADGQVLAWRPAPPRVAGIDPAALAGTVVDDVDAELVGGWQTSTSVGRFVGEGYRHDGNAEKGSRSARFVVAIEPGRYEVRLAYAPHANRAGAVPVRIEGAGEPVQRTVDQRRAPPNGPWLSLGRYAFAGPRAVVTVSNAGTDGYVVVDAVQLLRER